MTHHQYHRGVQPYLTGINYLKVGILFVFILILSSCNPFITTGTTEGEDDNLPSLPPINPDISSEVITLEVWLDLDFVRDVTLFEEMATDFEQAYPQVEVNINSFIRQSMAQKVKLAVDTYDPPDLVQGHVYAMAGQGLAEPIEQQWQTWEATNPNAASQFLPEAMQEVTWRGNRYGIPLDVYTLVLLYNRDHFDELGLPYPEADHDLFTLIESAATLSRPEENRYGIGLTTDPWYSYVWITGAGGDVLVGDDETGFSLTLASETNIDVLTFMTEMIQVGYGPRPSTRPRDYEDARAQFLEGNISIYFGEPQDIHLIQSTLPDFPLGVAQLPKTPALDSATSVLGSSGLFIPRGARHQEVAFEFMKWATNDRYAVPMARQTGRYPAKIWLRTSPEFTENLALTPFFEQLEVARPYRLDLFPEVEELFSDAIKKSFYNISLPHEALQEAQTLGEDTMLETSP
ncbi:MAG: sugar ABC transporter substrate-binding protein [Chloroflexota bacterium]